ncbi:MAG: hypothetical protein WBR18_12355 [Anaerolineales bacterium]
MVEKAAADDETIELQCQRLLLPLLLVPYMRGSHTRGLIGFRNGSPLFVKDIKASQSQCRLTLTDQALRCVKLFPRWLLIEIPLDQITSVSEHPQLPEVMEVRYDQAAKGRLLRFLTSGTPGVVPPGVIYFHLGARTGTWINALRDHFPGSS